MRIAATALLLALLVASAGAVRSGFTATASGGESRFAAAPVFAPRLLEPPAIEGRAEEGETLTARNGEWAREPQAFRVEWLRCADDGCVAVGDGRTRDLGADDVGTRLRVRVTATNAGGEATATSEPTAGVLALEPPQNTAPPTVAGSATVGQTLTAGDGAWTGRRLSLARRWLRCTPTCSAIAGETDAAYLLTGQDAGATIKVEVAQTNARGSATATSAATPAVARATYTQFLCANPATGRGVASDGMLPSGLHVAGSLAGHFNGHAGTSCATGTTTPVVRLSTGGTYSTSTPDDRLVLEYRPLPGTEFRGATLYRQGAMSGRFSWAVNSASGTTLFATPRFDLCSWGAGCLTKGSTSDRFSAQNRVDVARGPGEGFNVTLACDTPPGGRCDADGSQVVRVFGARITLRDTATPTVTAKAGGLVDDAPLEPTEDLAFTAGDEGSGLYRVRVTIDGREVASRIVHDHQGRCFDHDPATTDPYEFSFRQPCALTVASALSFDTTTWPRSGRLRVYLEDAGRNTTTLVNRRL